MTPEYRIETEKQIKDYFKSFKDIGKIVNIKCEETFNDLGVDVNVWNVKTNKGAYWVVEGETAPMNLYTQNASYFSADEAYSFHMGITQRLSQRHQDNFKHIIDEIPLDIERVKSINRKLHMASQKLSIDLEPEEFQSIGLICRESLIALSKELCKKNKELIKSKGFKTSDFKNISNEFIDLYIPGSSNSELRSHARKVVEIAWSYSSSIVHSPSKTYPDVKIALLFTCAAVSLLENLFLKYIGFDNEPVCSNCGSNQIDIIETDKNKFVAICNSCENKEELNLVGEK
jgi:hypothetical protein